MKKYFYVSFSLFSKLSNGKIYEEFKEKIIESKNKRDVKKQLNKIMDEENAYKIDIDLFYETFSDSFI